MDLDNEGEAADEAALVPRSLPPILPEILSLVFFHAIRSNPPLIDLYGKVTIQSHPWGDAVRLSQICKAWRTIALRTPSIWTNVRSPKNQNIQSVLSRSGSLPISLWLDAAAQLPLILSLAGSRVKDLTVLFHNHPNAISLPQEQWQQLAARLSVVKTPRLESLTLAAADSYLDIHGHITLPWPCIINSALLQSPRPALQHLSISCLYPTIEFPAFPQLQSFYFCNLNDNLPPVSLLPGALAGMPVLEECSFRLYDEDDLEPLTNLEVRTREPLTLARLTSFSFVVVSYDYSVALLSHLRTPNLKKGYYEIDSGGERTPDRNEESIRKILTGLGLSESPGPESIQHYSTLNLIVRDRQVHMGLLPPPHDQVSRAGVSVEIGDGHTDHTNAIVLSNIRIPGLESLVIARLYRARHVTDIESTISQLLGHHPQIQHIGFYDSSISEVIRLLEVLQISGIDIASSVDSATEDGVRPLSRLSRLTFRGMEYVEEDDQTVISEWIDKVVDLVNWRSKNCGCPIQEIEVEDDHNLLNSESMAKLKAALPLVKFL